jgi:hypothetical protein
MLKEYIIYGLIGGLTGIFSFGSINKEEGILNILTNIKNVLIGFFLGLLIYVFFDFNNIFNINYGIFFVMLLGFERLFIRAVGRLFEDEEIKPENNKGKVVICEKIYGNYLFKIFIGTIFLVLLFFLFYLPYFIKINLSNVIINGAIWGAIGGLIGSGIRGAWKHSKKYGFDFIRFFRSPAIAFLFGGIFSLINSDLSASVILFSSIGGERMTVDLYKRFFKKNSDEYLMKEKKYFKNKIIFKEILKWMCFVLLIIIGIFQ